MSTLQNKQVLFLSLLLLSACATKHPNIDHWSEQNIFTRGWASVEDEVLRLDLTAGANLVNFSSPVLEGDRLIVGSNRFGVIAYDKTNGRKLWQVPFIGGIDADPLIINKTIYVGGNDGTFVALDLYSGNKLWSVPLDFPATGKPLYTNGRLVVSTINEAAYALDASTGKILWTYRRRLSNKTSIKGARSPALIDGKCWVGFADGALVVLEMNDGSVLLEKQFRDNPKFTDIDAQPLAYKQGVFVVSYDGKLRYLKHDGSLIWEYPAGGIRQPLISSLHDGMVLLASSDGNVYAIGADRAENIWHFILPEGVPTGMALVHNKNKTVLIVASSDNYIYAVNPVTGKGLGRISLGSSSGSFSTLAVDQEKQNFYLISHFGRVYQFHVN